MEWLKEFQKKVHANAVSKGWWKEPNCTAKNLMLITSELAEALEWDRKGNPSSDHIPEFSGVEEELADAIIRILDHAEYHKLDVVGAIVAKHNFNCGRTYKHGGKKY